METGFTVRNSIDVVMVKTLGSSTRYRRMTAGLERSEMAGRMKGGEEYRCDFLIWRLWKLKSVTLNVK